MADITFDITEKFGTISETARGWTRELNMVSWNGRPAKYDLREWDPEHEKMSKGLTFTKEEARRLRDILNDTDLD